MPTKIEQQFADKMIKAGWDVYHNGFPDFLCKKGNDIILVEVKAKKSELLKPHQHKMMSLLDNCAPKAFKWSPDSEDLYSIGEPAKQVNNYLLEVQPSKTIRNARLRKSERNKALLHLRQEHPDWSLKELGDYFNITKQRVSKILSIKV